MKKNSLVLVDAKVRFEVFTAVTMRHAVFWDVTPCCSCKNRRFKGTSVLFRATRRNISEEGILQMLKFSANDTVLLNNGCI
jgi:hypothetical protein